MAQTTAAERRLRLKELLDSGTMIVAPAAYDAQSARLCEQTGFEVGYVGSYAAAASRFGLPDVNLLTLTEIVDVARTVVDATTTPVIADAENGFNNAANIWRTVQQFESVGVSGIHIEDHEFGKHADVPQRLLPMEAMVAKVRAALDARSDPNFLIIARSDAAWALGDVEDAVRRVNAYADAGADLVMLPVITPPELAKIRSKIKAKVCVTDSPGFSAEDEARAGASISIYYGVCVLAAFAGVRDALRRLRTTGRTDAAPIVAEATREFEKFLGYDSFVSGVTRYGLV